MVKNKTDFKIKDLKDINKSLTKSFKNIEKINDLNELTILHDNMMDFVIKCELTIQNSETNSTKDIISPKTKNTINEYINKWIHGSQVVYEKLSLYNEQQPIKVNKLKSMFFWLLRRRDYKTIDSQLSDSDYSVYTPTPERSYHYVTQPRSYTDEDLPFSASY